MTSKSACSLQHCHEFGQDRKRPGEWRTLIVTLITALMMVIEIAAGIVFGSMALLADGLHMASHAAALSINALAYIYARRHARDPRYSFGTGKINALSGFTGAILLAVFAVMMGWESLHRFIHPVDIAFNQAILVAVSGFIVNGVSVFILEYKEPSSRRDTPDTLRHPSDHGHFHDHDHNLRSAYLHVLADTLTSFLAIFALLGAKYLGYVWMDPFIGVLGALLVSRWSLGLLRETASVLLDHQASERIRADITRSVEARCGCRITDLHVWSIGAGLNAAIMAVADTEPKPPDHYKGMISTELGLVHITVEVHKAG
jgi:cation diffusion facilitator family transporter